MNSPLDGDTNQILQRLNGRAWVDTNRIAELEQQVRNTTAPALHTPGAHGIFCHRR